MSEVKRRCISDTCPVQERCARFMAPHGTMEVSPGFDYWHDEHEHVSVCKYRVPWPRVNEDKGGDTFIAVFIALLDYTADYEEVCGHFPCRGRGEWCRGCPFDSAENLEQFVDELNAKKEQG